ncbi:unnamed protein product, partial [marine sediment metagenome]
AGRPATLVTDALAFSILTDAKEGPALFMISSEDITLSGNRPDSSAQNSFEGTITDVVPARLGVEVLVDIGIVGDVEVAAMVTRKSVDRLHLKGGGRVWISFKATAGKVMEGS